MYISFFTGLRNAVKLNAPPCQSALLSGFIFLKTRPELQGVMLKLLHTKRRRMGIRGRDGECKHVPLLNGFRRHYKNTINLELKRSKKQDRQSWRSRTAVNTVLLGALHHQTVLSQSNLKDKLITSDQDHI